MQTTFESEVAGEASTANCRHGVRGSMHEFFPRKSFPAPGLWREISPKRFAHRPPEPLEAAIGLEFRLEADRSPQDSFAACDSLSSSREPWLSFTPLGQDSP